MHKFKISRTQKCWDIFHKFERKHQELFLKKLSLNKGFSILKDLYRFSQNITDQTAFRKLNLAKVQILSRIHFMFNKINL